MNPPPPRTVHRLCYSHAWKVQKCPSKILFKIKETLKNHKFTCAVCKEWRGGKEQIPTGGLVRSYVPMYRNASVRDFASFLCTVRSLFVCFNLSGNSEARCQRRWPKCRAVIPIWGWLLLSRRKTEALDRRYWVWRKLSVFLASMPESAPAHF